MPIIRNCILPDDLHYDVESDLWLTDVGQSRAGRILVITVRRPVGAEVNDKVLKRPGLMNEAFYTEGWLLRLAPSDPGERNLWPTAEEAIRLYRAKLAKPYRSVRGVEEDFWCVHCWEVGKMLAALEAEQLGVLEVPTIVVDGRERIVGVPEDVAALRARIVGARE